jgi:hypothetical protein
MRFTDRGRVRRRWRIIVLALFLVGAGLIAALPWILGRPTARRLLNAQANAILAPASVEFDVIHLSWFQPTEIAGIALHDAQGDRILVAPRAVFQWSLWQILFSRPGSATLTFPQLDLDIERLPNGTVDLYETLKPILIEHPRHRLLIQVEHGRLRFRDAALPEPILADAAQILLDVTADPNPIGWNIVLARTQADRESGRLELSGSYSRAEVDPSGRHDWTVSLKGSRWPWTVAGAGIRSRGDFDGTIDAHRRAGHWTLSGDAAITNLEATAERLSAHPIHLDTIQAAWTVDGQNGGWTIQPLEVTAPLGRVTADRPDSPLPPPPPGSPRDARLDREVRLVLSARYQPDSDQVAIREIAVKAPYAGLEGTGTISGMTAGSRVELQGSLRPDWTALNSVLVREVEPNARIAGRPRAWRLAGTIPDPSKPDWFRDLRGELGIQLDALDLFGMQLSETAVVLRAEDGRLRFDPIDATLNGGALHLEPEWTQGDEGQYWLKLGPSSRLHGAVVNDEVSHRVLSYAAPILDGATRVQGQVSVKQIHAEFPILAKSESPARIEGEMLFDNVRFLPGPLAEELMSILPKERRPRLVLHNPVAIRIADRKVYQEGLIVPVGNVAAIGLEGSVDFDKKLDLVARFTMNSPRDDMPVISSLLKSARFELPIRGTLEHPKIDTQAMKQRLKSLGSDLLEGSIAAGAEGLQRLLQKLPERPLQGWFPRIRRAAPTPSPTPPPPALDPQESESAAPPDRGEGPMAPTRREARKPPAPPVEKEAADRPGPLTPQERRARREQRRLQRLEKKAERRLKRQRPPE